ncbi:MAG: STAS domain-containing protein [Desulfobacterales bacterium]|nr:STAS domain-containing protein [Desulfobacterales bacterium]
MSPQSSETDFEPIHRARIGNHEVVSPRMPLIQANCGHFESVFKSLLEKNSSHLILDLKAVPFMDSKGLEWLIELDNDVKSKGRHLKLVGLNDLCRDILMATRLINVLQVYDDLHGAVKDSL